MRTRSYRYSPFPGGRSGLLDALARIAIRHIGTALLFAPALALALGSAAVAASLKPPCVVALGCVTEIAHSQTSPGVDADAIGRVHALFDFSSTETGPFPSDYFTDAEDGNVTGRRVSLPYPDCRLFISDCADLDVINTLDGFGLQTRVSIPFDGHIDPATVNSQTVFLIGLPSPLADGHAAGSAIGINQTVWDPATLTLHVETDDLLDQHRRYAVIVTRGVLDTTGVPVKATKEFRHLRTGIPPWYRNRLLE
jgi:hypothetical protein